jgi:release factor glutamine methyltransferase
MASVSALLDAATTHLAAALDLDARDARLDARVLAAHAWDVSHVWLIAHDRDPVDTVADTHYQTLIERRATGEPVAYLVGRREFYGRPFHVTPDVLIPRPDTELLVERALAHIHPDTPVNILDLGTGSGCIALTLALERPRAHIVAVDRSPAALAIARINAQALGARIEYLESDWFSALAGRRFNIIVSNPPYIATNDPHLAQGDVRFEPRPALTADKQGLNDLTFIIHQAPAFSSAHARLLLEHGHDQGDHIRNLFRKNHYTETKTWLDIAGHPRVTEASVSK